MPLDLVVLVPCKAIEQALRGVLGRHQSLGIRELPPARIKFIVHPGRDPGVYKSGHEMLDPFVGEAAHALIVFDRAWEGAPSQDPTVLSNQFERDCQPQWGDRARCVCIDPEVEAWVWSHSPHVATELGWDSLKALTLWLRERGLWPADLAKPPDPKAAFEAALREKRIPPSSAIFGKLAKSVSFARCKDPAFTRLLGILQGWFPAESPEQRV